MPIIATENYFRLDTKTTSYIFCVHKEKYLAHLYWGRRLPEPSNLAHLVDTEITRRPSFTTNIIGSPAYLEDTPLEFACCGTGDNREPVFHAVNPDGSTVCEFCYEGYHLSSGKPKLEGLPATYSENPGESQTLEIITKDPRTGLRAILSYSIFDGSDAIARSIRYKNSGSEIVEILNPGSMGIDLWGLDYKILHLHGDHMRERNVEVVPVTNGLYSIESKRGHSSHMQNPFVALLRGTDEANMEHSGEAFGFSLVYSGNFRAIVEGSRGGSTRVAMGINPFNFHWLLAPGGTFQTPEVVLAYSASGLDGLSAVYHPLYRSCLCRGKFKDKQRPMLINNWEATGMHFTEKKILEIAKAGAEIGLELLVLDDGWFGHRDNDLSSLGDWVVNKEKLPNGLSGLAHNTNSLGLQFGLWFEPEMVSPDSDLYRAHPDYCLHAEGRPRTEGRNQLVLDFSKPEVRELVISSVTDILHSANITYVKWDCNRNINETAYLGHAHKHMLGVYEVMEKITSAFPDVLFEGCSGGGGRFDPGMLYYMPQTWTSDNTDPVDRIKIQHGTSIVYPPSSMVAHIGRTETGKHEFNQSLHFRALVAMCFNFGFQLDLSNFSDEEKEQSKEYVKTYRKIREVVQFGDFHRLESPFAPDGYASWIAVRQDKAKAVAFFFQTRPHRNGPDRRVRLRGLDPGKQYLFNSFDGSACVRFGAELMEAGLKVPMNEDATMIILETPRKYNP
ncbi:MAG: alpha-galactosidase [Clostridiales bacterium]|jgi:alpha-galactosidase|nr:alpha-galactosidase [Clostridiales bacterium]